MFTATYLSPNAKVIPASRCALEASCLKRTLAGTFIARRVAPATIPVCLRPLRNWKRLTAAVSGGVQAVPLASAPTMSPSIASLRRSTATGAPLAPGESAAGTTGQPPASTIAA